MVITKLSLFWQNAFFSYLNPTSYLNAESCYTFAICTFRLLESYKSLRVRPPLEILRHFSTFPEAATRATVVIITGKHLCWDVFFNKVVGYQSLNFIKKRLQHRYFLTWITWIMWLVCYCRWRPDMVTVGALFLCMYVCFISIWRNIDLYRYKV